MTARLKEKGEKPPDRHMTRRPEKYKLAAEKGEALVIGPTRASMNPPATSKKQRTLT